MSRAYRLIQIAVERLVTAGLLLMVVLTFLDVIGRRLFSMPIYGAHDLTEHLMVVVVLSGLPLLTARHGHLSVDLFDRVLMRPAFRWWHRLVAIGMAVILALISYEYLGAALEASSIQEISQELGIPRGMMYGFISFTTALAALASILTSGSAGQANPGHEEDFA